MTISGIHYIPIFSPFCTYSSTSIHFRPFSAPLHHLWHLSTDALLQQFRFFVRRIGRTLLIVASPRILPEST